MNVLTEKVKVVKNENRIHSGVTGLDKLIGGGFRTKTVNILFADSGCGKSTFCWQYSAADKHIPTLFISLEQDFKSIARESVSIGIDGLVKKKYNGSLHFIHAFSEENRVRSGKVAYEFLMEELPKYLDFFVKIASKYPDGMRVILDPITPLLFEIDSLKEQRDVVNRIFQSLRKIGTSVITLEKGFGEEMVKIPLFLADSIIELDFIGLGSKINRTLRIRKFRGSNHSECPHPIEFVKNAGIVVHTL